MQVRVRYCNRLAGVPVEIGLVFVHVFVIVPLAVIMLVVMVPMTVTVPMTVSMPVMIVLIVNDLLAVARSRLVVALDVMAIAVAVPAFLVIRVLFVHWRVSRVSRHASLTREASLLTAAHTCTPP